MRLVGKNGEGGFSLIEVLIAVTILAIGLLGLALMQTTAIKGNAIASKSSVAVQAAQDKLEWFRTQPFAGITSSGISDSATTVVYTSTPGGGGHRCGRRHHLLQGVGGKDRHGDPEDGLGLGVLDGR